MSIKFDKITISCIIVIGVAVLAGISLMIADFFTHGDHLLDAGIMTTILGSIIPAITLLLKLKKEPK